MVKHPFLIAPILDDRDREAMIRLAAPVDITHLEALFDHLITTSDVVEWDQKNRRVSAYRRTKLDAITLSDHRRPFIIVSG